MQEFPVGPEGGDDAAGIAVVGDVAARAAGHEDLHPRLLSLLQEEHAAAALGGMDRGHEPCGARTGDDGVEIEAGHATHRIAGYLEDMRFSNPEFLWLSPIALLVVWWCARRQRPAIRYSDISF